MTSTNRTARLAGFLYLIFILATIIADAVGRSNLIVSGDAAATAANIMASEGLFRIGLMADLAAALLFLLTAWALYVLLRSVDKNIALLFLLLNVAGVAVQAVNMLNLFAALLIAGGEGYLAVFPADQLNALALFFTDLHANGFLMAQIFFGAWLFPLGYLVYKSGFLPRILGIILMVHCFAWLAYFFQSFLFPGLNLIQYISFPLGFIAEFGLGLWLLIKGVKE